jgi:hypothetical protein
MVFLEGTVPAVPKNSRHFFKSAYERGLGEIETKFDSER